MINRQKAALRAEFKARRAALSPEERMGRNRMLWKQVFRYLSEIPPPKTLLLYAPLPHEISLIPIFHYAREHGILCAFPRCGEQKGEMEFYWVDTLDELEVGKYGIQEPRADAERITDFSDTLAFVPALAFDRKGYRIGYGGGYYDRFFSKHGVKTVGVIYEEFLTDSLPVASFDIAVDVIVTETQFLITKKEEPQ